MMVSPAQEPDREPTLADVIAELSKVNQRIDDLSAELEKRDRWQEKMTEQAQGWQDRTWDVIKWVGGISAGLSVSAAIALIGLFIKVALE